MYNVTPGKSFRFVFVLRNCFPLSNWLLSKKINLVVPLYSASFPVQTFSQLALFYCFFFQFYFLSPWIFSIIKNGCLCYYWEFLSQFAFFNYCFLGVLYNTHTQGIFFCLWSPERMSCKKKEQDQTFFHALAPSFALSFSSHFSYSIFNLLFL